MIQVLTVSDFRDAFRRIRPENFTYEGLGVLYNFFEDFDPSYELDVIAICCDFREEDIDDALSEFDCKSLDELRDTVSLLLEVPGRSTVIIQD